MKSTELTPFAPSFMESSRAIGYSLEAAVSDIIDNSITAKAENIEVNFFPEHADGPYIYILDDGYGMSESILEEAMRYGSRSPTEERDADDLGRYGLGMKTASLSQFRKMTVLTKSGGKMSGRSWDLDFVLKKKTWSLLILEEEDMRLVPGYDKLVNQEQGTIVVWQNLDRLFAGDLDPKNALGKKMDILRDHLSLVFHRYIAGEQGIRKTRISLNNRPVIPTDPFLSGKSTQTFDDEIIRIENSEIVVRPYTLPHLSKLTKEEIDSLGGKDGLRKGQGFYVYRNKRLLIWGEWFRLMRKGELSKLARIRVDIPNSLDDLWVLDIKKSTATPPEVVRRNLAHLIDKVALQSKRKWTYRGKKEVEDPEGKVWNRLQARDKSILYEINTEHPIISGFIEQHPETKRQLLSILKQIQLNLPLNQLYVDLTNDEKIENDSDIAEKDALLMLKELTQNLPTRDLKLAYIELLKKTEPFDAFEERIDEEIDNGGLP